MEIPKRLWIGMVVLGACARLLPHPWNFTPMIAIGLFAGNHARKTSTGILATISALALSDAVMGFYSGFWYVYGAMLIPVLLGRLLRNRSGAGPIAATALASSLSFFLITNFMVWAIGTLYPHTIAGLIDFLSGGHTVLPESTAGRRILHSCDVRRLRASQPARPPGATDRVTCASFPCWRAPPKSSAPWTPAKCW